MKIILNILLYIAQWLHIKMGGKVEYTKKGVTILAPKGRHFYVPGPTKGDNAPK